MSRTLTVLFRRDPSRDRQSDSIHFEGYQPFWPDGKKVAVGLDAFCKHGQRLLGLGRYLKGHSEKPIKMVCLPLESIDDPLHRVPGHRVRRFFLERTGNLGRVHFLDGTPTTVTFEIGRDEPRVLHWIGLTNLEDGQRQWFDLMASEMETTVSSTRNRLVPCEI